MTKSYTELLEKYLDRTITKVELEQLEALAEADPKLQFDFDKHRLAIQTLRQEELRKELTVVMQSTSNRKTWAWAATFVVACSLALYFFLRPPLAERLYAVNYSTYPNVLVVRSGAETDLQSGYIAYTLGNYQEAVEIIRKTPEYLKGDAGALFYVGLSLIELGKHDEAIDELSRVPEDSDFYPIALWYQGLAMLIEDPEGSKEVFRKIVDSDYNNDKAARILKRLR